MLRIEQLACRLPSALTAVFFIAVAAQRRKFVRRRTIYSFGASYVAAQTAWAARRVLSPNMRGQAREPSFVRDDVKPRGKPPRYHSEK
jgi:hypothetical protein